MDVGGKRLTAVVADRRGEDPQSSLQTLVDGVDLTATQAEDLFTEIMDGRVPPATIGAILAALAAKGECAAEVVGAARVMRARATRIESSLDPSSLVDTCGTGGDFSGSFNISTTAAFVVAAGGVPVAKHGNRAASSKCGSADVLEALGVPIDLSAATVAHLLETVGIGFLFAPRFHPAMKHAVGVRREIGIRTIFNLLGPLTNPAGARRQVIGVPSPEAVTLVADVLQALGSEHALVVHGASEGLDEISVSGPTIMAELINGQITERRVDPSDLGLETFPADALAGGDAGENATITRAVLEGRGAPTQRSIVAANAGAALYVGGAAMSVEAGTALALELLASGAGADLLDRLVLAAREDSR